MGGISPPVFPNSMTPIEQALFRDGSAHCVSSFDLSQNALVLVIHPWLQANVATQARFEKPHIVSIDASYADENSELPWDIIGFDSAQLSGEYWRFCLHTDSVEYAFESTWPQITKFIVKP